MFCFVEFNLSVTTSDDYFSSTENTGHKFPKMIKQVIQVSTHRNIRQKGDLKRLIQ